MSEKCKLTIAFMRKQYELLEDDGKSATDLAKHLGNGDEKQIRSWQTRISRWRRGSQISPSNHSKIEIATAELTKKKG